MPDDVLSKYLDTFKSPSDRTGALKKAAADLGVDAADLGSIISFETGGTFNPHKVGGEGGRYKGLIQFGQSEQKSYYKPTDTFETQVTDGVVRYFRDRFSKAGRKTQGASLEDLYTTVIAGSPTANRDAKDSFGTSARSGTQRILKEHRPQVLKTFFNNTDTRANPLDNYLDQFKGAAPNASSLDSYLDQFKQQSVPESRDTIALQRQAAADPTVKSRNGVLLNKGDVPDMNEWEGFGAHEMPDGRPMMAHYESAAKNLNLKTPDEVDTFLKKNPVAIERMTGIVDPVSDTGGGQPVVTAQVGGKEAASAVVTSPEKAAEQAAVYKEQFPNAQIGEATTDDIANQRQIETLGGLQPTDEAEALQPQVAQLGAIANAAKAGRRYDQPQVQSGGERQLERKQVARSQVDAPALGNIGDGEFRQWAKASKLAPTPENYELFKRQSISINPSDFTIDGEPIMSFSLGTTVKGGQLGAGEREYGKATDDLNRVINSFAPTSAKDDRDAAIQALVAVGRKWDITEEEAAKYVDSLNSPLAKKGWQPGTQIQVTYKDIAKIRGEDTVKADIGMEQAQGRTENPRIDLSANPKVIERDAEILKEYGAPLAALATGGVTSILPEETQKDIGALLASGVLASGGRTSEALAGVLKAAREGNPIIAGANFLGFDTAKAGDSVIDFFKDSAKSTAALSEATDEQSSLGKWPTKIVKLIGGTPGDLSRLAILSKLPGGAITGFTLDSALPEVARDSDKWTVVKAGAKGATIGALFAAAPGAGKLLGLGKPILQEGVELGTIAGGTYAVARGFQKLSGEDNPDHAFEEAILNSLFHLSGKIPQGLTGKTVRARNEEGKRVTVTVDKDGKVTTVDPKTKADIELFIPKNFKAYAEKDAQIQAKLAERPVEAKTEFQKMSKAEQEQKIRESSEQVEKETKLPEGYKVGDTFTKDGTDYTIEDTPFEGKVGVSYTSEAGRALKGEVDVADLPSKAAEPVENPVENRATSAPVVPPVEAKGEPPAAQPDTTVAPPSEPPKGEAKVSTPQPTSELRVGDRVKDVIGRKGVIEAKSDGTLFVRGDKTESVIPLSDKWKLVGKRPLEQNGLRAGDVVRKKDQIGKVYERGGQLRVKWRANEKTKSEPLSDAWSKTANPEAGAVSPDLLTLGLNRTVTDDIVPAAKNVATTLRDSADDIKKLVFAGGRGEAARLASGDLRKNLAQSARSFDIAEKALKQARNYFARNPVEDNYDFISKVETGNFTDLPPEEAPFARELRRLLDESRSRVQALGTGKLDQFIENYFPHIWQNPKKAENIFAQIMAKRPFEGSKAFLKKRTINTFQEGIDAGLTPMSDNPIDLTLLKIREMNRYIAAHDTLNYLKEKGLAKFVKIGDTRPDGFVKINDKISQVFYRGENGELIKTGEYFAAEPSATIINNYLSPGLRDRSSAYRAWLFAGNLLNQFQLGFSAFHLGFTSVDAATSKLALAVNQLAAGHPIKAVGSAITSPLAPITNIIRGDRVLREWATPNSTDPVTRELANLAVQAGARAKMDDFYHTRMASKMMDAFKKGNILGGLIRTPFGVADMVSKPVMEWIVPRQKFGVFADLAKFEIDRLGADATPEQIREAMGRVWDSVDNRMGQLVYDNLFWNKVVKDLSMGSVRSVGWNLGTMRELGGAVKDTVALPLRIRQHVKGNNTNPIVTYRMAYAAALPVFVGVLGAMVNYLFTGQPPDELKDYYFPKTGNLDENGRPERLSLPSYVKDVYAYYDHPKKTLGHKLHPLIALVGEMLNNEDFYGTKIRNEDDPIITQLKDAAIHIGKGFEPFSTRGLRKEQERKGTTASMLLPFIGLTPAPASINKTDAEELLAEIMGERTPKTAKTKQEAERTQLMREFTRELKLGRSIGVDFDKAEQAGILTKKDLMTIKKRAQSDYLTSGTNRLPLTDAFRVFEVATPDEQAELRKVIQKKIQNKDNPLTDKEKDLIKQFGFNEPSARGNPKARPAAPRPSFAPPKLGFRP